MYKWIANEELLRHHHTISSPQDASAECPRALCHTEIAGIPYLAVANVWNNNGCAGPSYVYRLVSDPTLSQKVPRSDEPKDIGFQAAQTFETKSATAVLFGHFGSMTLLLIASEEKSKSSILYDGRVDVYKFNLDSHFFTELQTLKARRSMGFTMFTLPNVGHMLAVASRQNRNPSSPNDYEAYDGSSAIFVWDASTALFTLYQDLTNIPSVIEDEASFLNPSLSAAKRESFCGMECHESSDRLTLTLPILRGATSISAFESDGEFYLAVAQSVCEPFVDRATCKDDWAQPKSAILQFNKETKLFGEMLAMTDAENVRMRGCDVPVSELRMHSQALRIDAGRALKWDFVEAGNGVQMLILCSSTHGAIVYPWHFETVRGLGGVAGVLESPHEDPVGPYPEGQNVLAVSRLDSALIRFRRRTVRDSLGFEPMVVCQDGENGCHSLCSNSSRPCLQFVSARVAEDGQGQGLPGFGLISNFYVGKSGRAFHQIDGEDNCRSTDCVLIAAGRLHDDELLCGDFSAPSQDGLPPHVQCQELSFRITMTSTDDDRLFQGQDSVFPSLDPNGALHFKPAVNRSGHAVFSVRLEDGRTTADFASSGNRGKMSSFSTFKITVASKCLIQNCSGHGTCVNASCTCDEGYAGSGCEKFVGKQIIDGVIGSGESFDSMSDHLNQSLINCSNNCSLHGFCANGTCTCKGDWSGANCTQALNTTMSDIIANNWTDVGDGMLEEQRSWGGGQGPQNAAPSAFNFSLPKVLRATEDEGPVTRMLAFDIQIKGLGAPAYEEEVFFTVNYDNHFLFMKPPTVSADGNVHFTSALGHHGVTMLTVQMFLGHNNDGASGSLTFASRKQTCTLKIFPKPRIDSIIPLFGPVEGGVALTIKGIYFGSAYSRGRSAAAYGGFQIHLGSRRCRAEKFISDSEVLCLTPAGSGLVTVSISINDEPDAVRSGILVNAYSYVELLIGGLRTDSPSVGLVGLAPPVTGQLTATQISYESFPLDIRGSVLSVVSYHSWGIPCFGGSFKEIRAARVSHVFCWDGVSTRTLGQGVDGTVMAMVNYREMLLVGGVFNKAFQAQGNGFASTGSLAAWNGTWWSDVGTFLSGTVHAMVTDGSLLYVGGGFQRVNSLQVGGLARYDGQQWSDVGGGVGGGRVYAIAIDNEFLYVGGSFRRAGGVLVDGLARWDSKQWLAFGHFNGDVHGVAVLGADLYVAGKFTKVDALHADHIVRYNSGRWKRVAGGGVNGGVSSLAVAYNCLYFTGSFTRLRDAEGADEEAAGGAGRFCPAIKRMQGMLANTSGSIPRQVAAAGGSDSIAIDLKARTWQSEMH